MNKQKRIWHYGKRLVEHGEEVQDISLEEIYSRFEESRELFPSTFGTEKQKEILYGILSGIQNIEDPSLCNKMRKQLITIAKNRREACEQKSEEQNLLSEIISKVSDINLFESMGDDYHQMHDELMENIQVFANSIATRRRNEYRCRRNLWTNSKS